MGRSGKVVKQLIETTIAGLRGRRVDQDRRPEAERGGERNFLWARAHMGTLTTLAEKYGKSKPLEGVKLGVCLHVTKETSVLIDALLMRAAWK